MELTTTSTSTNPMRSPTKKARYMSSWESSLYSCSQKTHKSLSISDLFDARQWLGVSAGKRRRQNGKPCLVNKTTNTCTNNAAKKNNSNSSSRTNPVSLRLEHREGGALATHPGEERILLFRSDRPGAIAKIIFSSSPPSDNNNDDDSNSMAHAKIHVVDVKDEYRGYDLGGLLFSEALLALKHRYLVCCCQLDAEEDIRRHNKLVHFYERLGCSIKPKARPQFLNNNDGETYRKVPMQIDLRKTDEESDNNNNDKTTTKTLVDQPFLPILLLGSRGKPGRLLGTPPDDDSNNRATTDWLLVEDGHGYIQFRTTLGRYLAVGPEGNCWEQETPSSSCVEEKGGGSSEFQLLKISDRHQQVLSGEKEEALNDDLNHTEKASSDNDKELWVLLSAQSGRFLTLHPTSCHLYGSQTPTFWQANSGDFSLTCTPDTPTRRQHYRQLWTKQTVDYVLSAREKYLKFCLGQMTIQDALNQLQRFPGYPFRLDMAARNLSLRTLAYRTAEAARAAGHPDWVQFIALIHGLGSIVNCLDTATAIASEDDFDWTIPCRSRVVGCAAPEDSIFSEFAGLNPDKQNSQYSSPLGMYSAHCGLENVLLTWSGPEYLSCMLRHNQVDLPDEGYAVLRLFPLYDWHANNMYANLANEDDEDVLSFLVDFDRLRRRVRQETLCKDELTDEDCNELWDSHYAAIASKFGAEALLHW